MYHLSKASTDEDEGNAYLCFCFENFINCTNLSDQKLSVYILMFAFGPFQTFLRVYKCTQVGMLGEVSEDGLRYVAFRSQNA